MSYMWGDDEVYRKTSFLYRINHSYMPVMCSGLGAGITNVVRIPDGTYYKDIKEEFDFDADFDLVVVENEFKPQDVRDRLVSELEGAFMQGVENLRVLALVSGTFNRDRITRFPNLVVTWIPYRVPVFTRGFILWEHLTVAMYNRGVLKIVPRSSV
jgi:hypothetical protein